MDITELPFIKRVGVTKADKGVLKLSFNESVYNHLHTIHAGAQFTLAETASGHWLQEMFPDFSDQVIPVLRDAQIKYRKPANKAIYAYPFASEDAVSTFRERLLRKGRATISMDVEIKDAENVVTCSATFKWYVEAV